MSNNYQEMRKLLKKNQDAKKSDYRKMLESRGYEFDNNGNIVVDLITETNNGKKNFGKITYDAYKAIEGNTLDSYTPKTEEEKKVLDGYKQYIGLFVNTDTSNTNKTNDIYVDTNKYGKGNIDISANATGEAKQVIDRYGIDANSFTTEDLHKWATEHNFDLQMNGEGDYYHPKRDGFLGIFGKKLTTDQEEKDLKTLTLIASNNARRDASQTDGGAPTAFALGASDGITFGAMSYLGDKTGKYEYEKAGLDPNTYFSFKQMTQKTHDEHPYATLAGEIAGSSLYLGVGGKEAIAKGVNVASDWASTYRNILKAGKALGATKGAIRTAKLARTLPTIMTMATPAVSTAIRHNSKMSNSDYAKLYKVQSEYNKNPMGKGNIDLTQRPIYQNADGTISTVRSMTITENGKAILIPTIVYDNKGNAQLLPDNQAIEYYHQTGEHLGIFDSIKEADEYAKQLSKDQDIYYSNLLDDKKDTPVGWFEKQIAAGNAQYAKGLAASLDLILPTEVLGKYDLISKVNDFYGNTLYSFSTEAQKSSSNLGKGWETAGEAIQVVTAALPNSITALFLAGANVPGQAVQVSSNKTINAVANYLMHTAKNPQYWTSVLQTLGTDYEEARSRGANDAVATAYAVVVTAINAGIELGGYQALPDKLMGELAEDTAKRTFAQGFFDWLTSSFEEGGEEVLQSFVSNIVAKIFDHETKWVSETDDKAVLNLSRAAKEFGMGMFAGMVLSGGQIAAVETINRANTSRVGNYMQDFKDEVIATGLESPPETESHKIAQKLSNKKSKVSDYELGKLHIANIDQIEQEEQSESETVKAEEPAHINETSTISKRETVNTPVATEQRNTFTEELDEISSTEMPTVSVGDIFVENSGGKFVKVVSRDDTTTTVEITTSDGKTVTRPMKNMTADTLAVNDSYTKVEAPAESVSSPAETVVAENATATTETVAPQTEAQNNTSVKVGDAYKANDNDTIYTIVERDAENTTYEYSNGKEVVRKTTTNLAADITFNNSDAVEGFTKVQNSQPATSKSQTKKQSPKIIRAKKSDWASHDIYWYAPNTKIIIAYSTRAASDLVEAMSKDNPKMTISELHDAINYDMEAKKVLQAYINSGFGGYTASEHFTDNEGETVDTETPKAETKPAETDINKERNKIREKAKKTGEINLDELGVLTGIPVTHMSNEVQETNSNEENNVAKSETTEKSDKKTESIFIDDRTWEDVSNREVKAFQYENPEVKPFYKSIAQELRGDLKNTVKGERFSTGDFMDNTLQFTGTKRFTSESIARIKDTTSATYDEIDNALQRIINDEGQENIALAKKIELVIDDMLTEGYTSFDGQKAPPNEEYIAIKEKLGGKEYVSNDNEFNDLPFDDAVTQDKAQETAIDTKTNEEVLNNQPESDTIKEKTSSETLTVAEKETTETEKNEDVSNADKVASKGEASKQIADYVAAKLAKGEKLSATELSQVASKAFGGTMADNAYSIKDAYDAMELGVNQHILSMKEVSADKMIELLELLPTQTKRTEEMVKFQQFSTPPSIAYLANYTANVTANDIMLEPSAGIGGIAVFAKKDGAKVYVNELDNRRLEVLKNMPFDGFFNENAEQLDNILGGKIEPTVIVMNPPFSSSAERNMKKTKIGASHIEQALKILAPNGRLVAIVGKGMADGEPAFRNWWNDIKSQYNVRANIGINGKNYNKYGTNFDIQMLVIDKNGPTTQPTVTAYVDTLQELQEKLGGIRDERPAIDYSANEQRTPTATRQETVTTGKSADSGNSSVSDTSGGTDIGKSADKRGNSEKSTAKDIQSTDTEHGKSDSVKSENTDVLVNESGRVGSRQSDGLVGEENSTGIDNSDSEQSDIQTRRAEPRKRVKKKELTDSIFEQYQPQQLRVKNAQPHPAKVSESAAMSAIEPPVITYKPNIPQDIIDKGVVSDVQLEAISYAGQSHSQTLPNGATRGFFLGDGTGIGKGRTIAGMMLDNYNQGRKKAVWVTLNSSLVNDAKRDVKALFGNSDLVTQFVGGNKADSVLNTDEAIMVISYSALSKGFDNKDSNFEKIVNWLGKDFDGLIVFDEAHKMGNATSVKGTRGVKKASQTGLAGIALQEALPNAKVVYSSATGATEVENLRYAERLGLWGEGTPFIKGDDFVSKVKAGGLAAMELIARDMKAMGVYLSRNISYDDVQYDKITHNLTAQQTKIYDELASSWQIVLQNINKALESTNQDKDGHARGRALGAFWSAQQRFFNQILTSMQVPSVISDIEKQLADGKSCVIQLVSTNEAAQNQEFERLKSEDLELDEFDLTPKQVLMSLIENSFPVQQFDEYRDDNGNVRSRPVYDSQGNPVINREAVRQREELLTKLGSIKVPSSPIDMIINHFGTEMVAENTGRARRVIQKDGKTIEEKIGSKKDADVDAFQNGKKRIIIFSKAGGTGKSYHADKSAKNQQQRVHYLLEAGWQADNAVQGFGRSHRSNQSSAPIFKLVTTNLKGQMRFISTIAKRLDQLGAMTKGQRQAGGQGMFSASDNLENSFAADVLAGFYKDLVSNRVDGIDDGLAILEKLGLKNKILDEYGRIMPTAPELREVNKFLNRILSLESAEQNTVFEGYSQRLQDATEKAMQTGTLDKGLENYKADKITLNEVQDIREDESSGAKTKYYNLTAEHKIKPVKFEDIPTESKSFVGYYKNKNTGNVRAVMHTSSSTDQYGNVTQNYKLIGQIKPEYIPQHRLYGNWAEIKEDEARKVWNEELSKLPEFRKENLHLISGVVLPVWDKLPTENVRIYRVLTSDGEMLIGRVVSEDMIDETLRRLGSSRKREKIATKDLITSIKNGEKVYLENDWMLTSRKVSGEDRIELMGPSYEHHDMLMERGVFAERIQYRTRYFIPANTNTEKIIDDIIKLSPVMRVENSEKYSISIGSEGFNDEQTGNDLLSGNSNRGSNASARKQAKRISDFKQKLKGKTKAERRNFAKELLEQGKTEEITDGKHQFNVVKEDAYNDDMLSIVEEAKEMGLDVGFFVGHGKLKFSDLKIDAIEQGNKILLRYDGTFAPQSYFKHENTHIEWNNPEMQKARDIILNDLSAADKKKILSQKRYQDYMTLYKDKENKLDLVWQEFVADVFGGMSEYTSQYIDLVVDYWYDGKVIDRYNPAEYVNSIDAGGNETVLDSIGFGDDNVYKYSFVGEKALTADKTLLERAKEMLSSGKSQDDIFNKTGWFKGADGKWRFEIDDSKAEFSLNKLTDVLPLETILNHDALYKAYPFLKIVRVKAVNFGNDSKKLGEYDSDTNTISISDAVLDAEIMQHFELLYESTLMHEVQHAIQYYEGFAPGSSPGFMEDYLREQAEFYLADSNDEKFNKIIKEGTVKELNQYVDDFIKKEFKTKSVADASEKAYYLVHGEKEARSTGKRLKLSAHERANMYPNFEKGAILLDDSKTRNTNVGISETSKKISESKFIEKLHSDFGRRIEEQERIKNTEFSQNEIKYALSIYDTDAEELTPERKKEIFEQFARDHAGVDKPTQKQIWGERAEWIAHNMTRVFPDIPERGERGTFFAEFRKMMIQWKALPQTSMFMTQDKLNKMTKDLTPAEFKTFSELVYFLDLQEEAQIQKERGYEEILLPNEIAPHEVNQIVDVLNKEATDNVRNALEKRRQIWDDLKEQYITLNQYIGFDTDGRFNRKNYYHHQVIEYMNQGGKGVAKGKDIEIKAGRGWLKERQGSTKATNTDFLAVEYKAMLQMQYDIYVANMLGKIKDQYDIKPQLEKQAFNHNKELLKQKIAEEATDENGNIMLDNKGKPDSETYRQQQWYNQRIMFGFSGLFDLAEAGMLPTFNGQYGNVIRALEAHNLNVPALYNYVGELASMELPETATDEELQARISARTVLKYTSQKKAWVKETLANEYQTWETLAQDMSDTHSIHQPRRGNYFYTKTTVDEDAFNKAFNDMIVGLVAGENGVDTTADMKKLFEQYSETVRLMGAAYEQWVIPNEIETTMNKVANPKQASVASQLSRTILSTWKGWSTSVNPLRTVKFGLRNLFGDLDAVIAGNPKIVGYSKRAVEEIYQAMKNKKYSPEFMEWVERGGYSSLIFANEMDTEMQDKLFSHLKNKEGLNIFKIPAKLFEGYYNGVETAHNFREAILRYSAYLYFKNEIVKNGGKVKDNVASNRYIIQGLQSVEDKAYQLSKDLLGAYDEVATMGQALRRHLIPFYSFTETNLKRYYRLFENIIMSDDNIPKKAGKLLLKGLMVNVLTLLMVAWNKLVMKDEEDELPPSARNVPHITLGKIGDEVIAFRQLGSFSELLEWVGLEDYKWTEEDKTAALDKAVGMITPVIKTPVELLTGLNFYPSITQPRAIRDKVEHFFSTLGVDDIYRVVAGKPTKGIGDIAKGAVTYSYDYKESAYYEILDIKREYQGDTDNTIYGQTPKSNALYYMKTAIRYKDKKAALKYLDEYFENGGTAKGISQSIEMLNPMYGYTGKDTIAKGQEFVNSLSDDEKDKLKIAIDYYENDLMLPENVSAMLRKKGITDEQAKNLLTKYIDSKCN